MKVRIVSGTYYHENPETGKTELKDSKSDAFELSDEQAERLINRGVVVDANAPPPPVLQPGDPIPQEESNVHVVTYDKDEYPSRDNTEYAISIPGENVLNRINKMAIGCYCLRAKKEIKVVEVRSSTANRIEHVEVEATYNDKEGLYVYNGGATKKVNGRNYIGGCYGLIIEGKTEYRLEYE